MNNLSCTLENSDLKLYPEKANHSTRWGMLENTRAIVPPEVEWSHNVNLTGESCIDLAGKDAPSLRTVDELIFRNLP